jgi:uncharacterized protein with ParB-like and HNH nuclease domain
MKEYKRETISKIVGLINKSILLPDIQRPFVWEERQIYKLFDSLMRGYPISTFLFWDMSKEDLERIEENAQLPIKMYKFLDANDEASKEEVNRSRDSYSLVLDGQQRLTSLYIALRGTQKHQVRKKTITQELYFDVLSGHGEEDEDGILYQFQFRDRQDGFTKVELDDEDANHIWVNVKKIYESEIGQAPKRKVFVESVVKSDPRLAQYRDTIDDNIDRFNDVLKEEGVINYFPVDEQNYDKVLDIFVRTNAGGTKLGYSDLLFSKIKLRWPEAREKTKEVLDNLNTHNFSFDTDFLLKTCLTIFSDKAEDVRYSATNLSESLIEKIVKNWEQIAKSTKCTVGMLNSFLIKDKKQLPSYNALIPLIYWHFKEQRSNYRQDSDFDQSELSTIRVWLTKALLSGAFSGQSDTALYKCREAIYKETSKSFPSHAIEANIKTMKTRSMDLNEDIFDHIVYRSKESYLFLSLCYRMAINFTPQETGNLPEQDHIFSKDELQNASISDEKINSIYNIRYVSLDDNRSKGKTPYSEWVKGLGTHMEKVFKTHLIPQGQWSVESFDKFLEARKEEMLRQVDY